MIGKKVFEMIESVEETKTVSPSITAVTDAAEIDLEQPTNRPILE